MVAPFLCGSQGAYKVAQMDQGDVVLRLERRIEALRAAVESSTTAVDRHDQLLDGLIRDVNKQSTVIFGDPSLNLIGVIENITQMNKIMIENQQKIERQQGLVATLTKITQLVEANTKAIAEQTKQAEIEKREKAAVDQATVQNWNRIKLWGSLAGVLLGLLQLINIAINFAATTPTP